MRCYHQQKTPGAKHNPQKTALLAKFSRKKLREGQLDDKEIDIDIAETSPQVEIMAPPGMEEMTNQLAGDVPKPDLATKRKNVS